MTARLFAWSLCKFTYFTTTRSKQTKRNNIQANDKQTNRMIGRSTIQSPFSSVSDMNSPSNTIVSFLMPHFGERVFCMRFTDPIRIYSVKQMRSQQTRPARKCWANRIAAFFYTYWYMLFFSLCAGNAFVLHRLCRHCANMRKMRYHSEWTNENLIFNSIHSNAQTFYLQISRDVTIETV